MSKIGLFFLFLLCAGVYFCLESIMLNHSILDVFKKSGDILGLKGHTVQHETTGEMFTILDSTYEMWGKKEAILQRKTGETIKIKLKKLKFLDSLSYLNGYFD